MTVPDVAKGDRRGLTDLEDDAHLISIRFAISGSHSFRDRAPEGVPLGFTRPPG